MRFFFFVCMAAVAAIYGCSDPALEKPEAVVGDAIPTSEMADSGTSGDDVDATGSPAIPGAKYILSKDCYIGFAGSKVGGIHYGQFPAYEGSIEIHEDDLETMKIDLTIDATKLETDSSILTGTLRGENFFDVENHPTATFKSTSVKKSGDGYTVTGNLAIRGVEKSVSFPASITLEGGDLTASAEFSIDRNMWGLGDGWVSDTVIRDNVAMELLVEAQLESTS